MWLSQRSGKDHRSRSSTVRKHRVQEAVNPRFNHYEPEDISTRTASYRSGIKEAQEKVVDIVVIYAIISS